MSGWVFALRLQERAVKQSRREIIFCRRASQSALDLLNFLIRTTGKSNDAQHRTSRSTPTLTLELCHLQVAMAVSMSMGPSSCASFAAQPPFAWLGRKSAKSGPFCPFPRGMVPLIT